MNLNCVWTCNTSFLSIFLLMDCHFVHWMPQAQIINTVRKNSQLRTLCWLMVSGQFPKEQMTYKLHRGFFPPKIKLRYALIWGDYLCIALSRLVFGPIPPACEVPGSSCPVAAQGRFRSLHHWNIAGCEILDLPVVFFGLSALAAFGYRLS